MAIEDKRYEELVKALNALIATRRTATVRNWLVQLAIGILNYYEYEVIMPKDKA